MFSISQSKYSELRWWYDNRDRIDFSPPYQRRGGLWPHRNKQYLIDTILNSYDIPKLYLADFTSLESALNVDKKMFAVIDGKQRFQAIHEFIDGCFNLAEDFVFAADPTVSLAGLSYADLWNYYPSIATKFDRFTLTVMNVVTDEEGRINELFLRLNSSKPLTGPEVRNAMKGRVPVLIRELADRDMFNSRVRFRTDRGQGLDAAAKMLLVEYRGRLVDTKKKTLDGLVREGVSEDAEAAESTVEDFERAKERVEGVLDRMERIFLESDPLLRTQGVVVPYYWFVRSLDGREDGKIRCYLEEFSNSVDGVRRALSNGTADRSDQDFITFDKLRRSMNDAHSLEGRHEILLQRFRDWNTAVKA